MITFSTQLTQETTSDGTGNSLALPEVHLIAPENRAKATQGLKKIEETILNCLKASMSNDLQLYENYVKILIQQVEKFDQLVNRNVSEFFTNLSEKKVPTSEDLSAVLSVLNQTALELPEYLKSSKLVPYLKVACSIKENFKNVDSGFIALFSLNHKYDSYIKFADQVCPVINHIENNFDDYVDTLVGVLTPAVSFLNDPLSLIGESEIV